MSRLSHSVFLRRAVAALVCGSSGLFGLGSARAANGPSFDCSRVTSAVNKMICASPELSARDRELSEHYRALLGQPGTDPAALQKEELEWLHQVRDRCPDTACIAQAYSVWDAVLQARSKRMASPAAFAETQPFAVEPALMLDARSMLGKACASGQDVPRDAGYLPVAGSLPVVSNGSVVLVRRRIGADFAFLLDTRRDACRIVDVVVLPPQTQAGHLLQCTVPSDDGSATPLSTGVGLRRPGQKAPIAYWEVDVAHGQFIRQPLGVLGWERVLRCQEPEVGD
jgi:uncharacterized protein YecT (DUF1311 family)